jgi:geranylgeranyl diphosphate synthase type II
MRDQERIEAALQRVVERALGGSPPGLAAAVPYAVFSGGGRIRPRLVLAVAQALGDPAPELTDAAAAALELIHCASLVHDDMPVFDDAGTRRGHPTVHRVFGEQLALLVGDGLIVEAFGLLARAGAAHPERVADLVQTLAAAAGIGHGIVAGQAWESEDQVDLERYHRAKTAALFEAATALGAIAAGSNPAPWRRMGAFVGQAYQTADDILDAIGSAEDAGKPVGQDNRLERPSVVSERGLAEAVARLDRLVGAAVASLPDTPGAVELGALLRALATRLCPPRIRERCFIREAPRPYREPARALGASGVAGSG